MVCWLRYEQDGYYIPCSHLGKRKGAAFCNAPSIVKQNYTLYTQPWVSAIFPDWMPVISS